MDLRLDIFKTVQIVRVLLEKKVLCSDNCCNVETAENSQETKVEDKIKRFLTLLSKS